jgi:hypothetical protein
LSISSIIDNGKTEGKLHGAKRAKAFKEGQMGVKGSESACVATRSDDRKALALRL